MTMFLIMNYLLSFLMMNSLCVVSYRNIVGKCTNFKLIRDVSTFKPNIFCLRDINKHCYEFLSKKYKYKYSIKRDDELVDAIFSSEDYRINHYIRGEQPDKDVIGITIRKEHNREITIFNSSFVNVCNVGSSSCDDQIIVFGDNLQNIEDKENVIVCPKYQKRMVAYKNVQINNFKFINDKVSNNQDRNNYALFSHLSF